MNLKDKRNMMLTTNIGGGTTTYNVEIVSYGMSVDVTVNGTTTRHTIQERGTLIDCGCIFLIYGLLYNENWNVITKGKTNYNGTEYAKGKFINKWRYSESGTFAYSGIDEPTPSGVTELYSLMADRYYIFTDTEIILTGLPRQTGGRDIGCINIYYSSGSTKITALKTLMYNGIIYQVGDRVAAWGYPTIKDAIFEEV